jgi:hypothetical protein
MYVQTVQNGTPTTTTLEAYLANNVPAGSTARLSADCQAIYEQLATLPPPAVVSVADLRIAETPVLMYESDGVCMPAAAYLGTPPRSPAVPPSPAPLPAKSSTAEQTAYDAAQAEYLAAKSNYDADFAVYQAQIQKRKALADQLVAYNQALTNLSGSSSSSASTSSYSWQSSPSSSSSGSTPAADALQAVANELNQLKRERGPVKKLLAHLEAVDAKIVEITKNSDGCDANEKALASVMAIHDLFKWLMDHLALRVSETAIADDDEATLLAF